MISLTIGIAVALYNGMRFLEKQLDTLRLQTRPADKVVLCDDGSTDGTPDFVRSYIEKFHLQESWHFEVNPKNLGYIRNFYKAMRLCGTDLIFLSDQDDIWQLDKLKKMADIMEGRPEINLLSCRYGIINADGETQQSVVEGAARQDEQILSISVKDIMQAYRWPGMIMCIRGDFFRSLLPRINDCNVAHDFMFCMCAADAKSFYEYGYLGAYHRRHDNNTAREEHRIWKLLNIDRKLLDIAETKRLWQNFLAAELELQDTTRQLLIRRLAALQAREQGLVNKSIGQILSVYRNDPDQFLRTKSLVCDLWLVLFSAKPKQRNSAERR